MNRRFLLASIATLSASRVVAQQMNPPAPTPSAGTESAQAPQGHNGRRLAIAVAELNSPAESDPPAAQAVRSVRDRRAGNGRRRLEGDPDERRAERHDFKVPTDAELMQNLDDAGKASVEKLRAEHAGAQFDRDYIRYQVEGHRKLLDIQEVYLKAPDNLDQTNVAKLARGMIKEHLTLLADMEKV